MDKIEAVWVNDSDSPEAKAAAAAKRTWAFEASVDVVGSKGNSDSMATAMGFAATQAGPTDKIAFYAAYARAEQEGATSADNAKAGIDYSSYFTPRASWYVREEIGTDKIEDMDFYSNTAAGLGYAVIRKRTQELTFRAGLAYRYEAYELNGNLSTAALDLGIVHSYTSKFWRIGNKLTFMPSLEDFANYRLHHDSFLELPLTSTQWKIRLGVANDYNSEPQPTK